MSGKVNVFFRKKKPKKPKKPTQLPRRPDSPKIRKVFSPEDDQKIISFLLNNKNIGKPYVWMQMEVEEIVLGWDWTSLKKKRFQNMKYRTKLAVYNLTDEEKEYLIQRKI